MRGLCPAAVTTARGGLLGLWPGFWDLRVFALGLGFRVSGCSWGQGTRLVLRVSGLGAFRSEVRKGLGLGFALGFWALAFGVPGVVFQGSGV